MSIKSRKEITTKITYYICCPECDKEIKGSSPSQVEYNLKIHLMTHNQSHRDESEIKQEEN